MRYCIHRLAKFWLLIYCYYKMVKQVLCLFLLDSILLQYGHVF